MGVFTFFCIILFTYSVFLERLLTADLGPDEGSLDFILQCLSQSNSIWIWVLGNIDNDQMLPELNSFFYFRGKTNNSA